MLDSDFIPMGTILPYVLNTNNIPKGWLPCDGSSISDVYQEFITAFGSSKTPNLVGRGLVGAGTVSSATNSDGSNSMLPVGGDIVINTSFGEYTHQLSVAEMPSHSHPMTGVYHYDIYNQPGDDQHLMVNEQTNTDSSGGDQPHNNMQPSYVVNFIIKVI